MRIKSYFADSVQEAIEKARTELGPEAMLMNSKKTDFELRALGLFEVVFGLPGQTAAAKPRLQTKGPGLLIPEEAPLNAAPPETSSAMPGDLAHELAQLRRQIETVKRSVTRRHHNSPGTDETHFSPAVEDISSRLVAADISEELAQEIAEAVEAQVYSRKHAAARSARDFDMLPGEAHETALAAELERRFQTAPELGMAGATQKIVLFAGPAGAGKTTSLIKLALRFGLQGRLPMHILSLDTLRVGGWEQLASYARIAGVGFDPVHSLHSLEQVLDRHTDKKLILIDTPGFGPADAADLRDLGKWLAPFAEIDRQLVLPATLRPTLLMPMLERFAPLKPSKLLLTRADEVESNGVLVDLTMRSSLPLSYISNGQTVPEDIEEASRSALLGRLNIGRQFLSKREAA